jgi:hypothetical protein
MAWLLGAGIASPAQSEQARESKPKANLDRQTHRFEVETTPEGGTVRKRSFKKPIPWDEYLEALAAEQGAAAPGAPSLDEIIIDPDPPGGGGGGGGGGGTASTCTPPADGDFDADGFTAATTPADERPLRQGPYVADRPRVTADFTSFIEPGITVKYNGQTEFTYESNRFHEEDIKVTTTVHEQTEITSKFNTGSGIKLSLGFKDKKPFISLGDVSVVFETERKRTFTWTRDTARTVEDKFTLIRNQKETGTLTVAEDAGKVTGQVTLHNVSDYPLDLDVSNVVIAVVAYSPFSGVKHAIGDFHFTDVFHLGYGAGNDTDSRILVLQGLNALEIMNDMAEGWVFDFELAGGFSAVERGTTNDIATRISRINGSNARISIVYGDTTPRQWGQVSVFGPNSSCLTAKDMLIQYVGAANVEFDHMPDGTPIVKRINHRANAYADQDFDSLTPAQQAAYGRWVVGFRFATQPLTQLNIETTVLYPEDKVYFYYVTGDDFRDLPTPPDVQPALRVGNDGSAPLEQVVLNGVNTNDRLQLHAVGQFRIEEAYSQFVGNVVACNRVIYSATYYGHRVKYDSRNHNITIPNADYYGLQVKFGGMNWLNIADIMADATAKPKMLSFRGFPYYDYVLEFRASPAMLGNYPTRNLQVRMSKARQSFPQVGWSGYDVAGRRTTCFHSEVGGSFVATGDVGVWYQINNADLDLDGYPTHTRTGLDFDDSNDHRFPLAPEFLDGSDNDGNGQVDENPMICPISLMSFETGTCSLDDRMGWYGTAPNIALDRRFRRVNGTTTAWEAIGNSRTYTFTMTSDPTVAAVEIRLTYYPPGGGVFSGSTIVAHGAGGAPPVYSVGQEFEAEAGVLTAPFAAATSGSDTYIAVPAGAPNYASATAEYQVQVTATGDYHIWSRVFGLDSSDDSFVVEVLDPAGAPLNFGYGTAAHFRFEFCNPAYSHGAFGWTRVGHYNAYVTPVENANPITYHLTPGTYTIRFRPRELGARLDKLRVDRFCPDADGDGSTTCAGDCNDNNPNVRPGKAESCSTSYDDDCDGYVNEGCGGGGSPVYIKVVE